MIVSLARMLYVRGWNQTIPPRSAMGGGVSSSANALWLREKSQVEFLRITGSLEWKLLSEFYEGGVCF